MRSHILLTIIVSVFWLSGLDSAIAQKASSEIHDNRELAQMFRDDQNIRARIMAEIKPSKEGMISFPAELAEEMALGDAERLARTQEMLRNGLLETAQDYWHAAYILQHGNNANDYLMAHHVAMVAMKLNHERASWIAAATLDRYLLSIGKKQIYGTQSQIIEGETIASDTNAGLITDREREQLSVPPLNKP